jgi:putative transposase
MVRDRFGVSERRACAVVGQHHSTQRLDPPPMTDEEARLREWLRDFSKRRPRWGWRRAAKAARRAGWEVNDKRIRRLWRDEGLRVPQRKRKKPLRGIGAAVGAMSPIRPNALWAMDFQFDVTADGRTLKLFNVIDEFTREALANAVADWCRFSGTACVFIDPGSPWQNAWIESFNGRLRDELLNGRQWDSLLEARVIIEDWRIDYNINRPHSAHGDLTPTEFADHWATINQPQAA